MNRPLLVTDCDEVLLHMVSHFGTWLGDAHAVDFAIEGGDFANALTHRHDGRTLARDEVWPLLNGFFKTEMARQTLVPGAKAALDTISGQADIVVLTNILDEHREKRAAQLRAYGIDYRVVCNQGGKGTPLKALLDELVPTVTVFVDDLAVHHSSVAKAAPQVWRLHMIAEPRLAATLPTAADAHTRIDDWDTALGWIEARFAEGPVQA